MQDIIKVKSASYKRYEELLLKKDALVKEAEGYRLSYEKIFDHLTKEVHQYRIDCVKKRKIISYCKSVSSQGNYIQKKRLDEFVEKAMNDYQETLDFLSNGEGKKEEQKKINSDETKKIKNTYHQLAKLVHPDSNSDLKDDKVIRDLWNRTCIAYNCANLEELEELSVLINRYLESINHKYIDIEIPDINEKIFNLNRAIYRITHTNPYQYKYIIQDEETVNRKKDELTKELSDYKRYCDELDEEIAVFDPFIIEED